MTQFRDFAAVAKTALAYGLRPGQTDKIERWLTLTCGDGEDIRGHALHVDLELQLLMEQHPDSIGGGLMPSCDPPILNPVVGKHGTFEIRPLPVLDTHGLFFATNHGDYAGQFGIIALIPNAYSLKLLVDRILETTCWGGTADVIPAIEEYDRILESGGLSIERVRMGALVWKGWRQPDAAQ